MRQFSASAPVDDVEASKAVFLDLPLRDASEQYTRNHMSVTDRDLQSRYPKAPDIESKRR
jgi:hypothetical protein